ncbi:MAG: hypothetical protein MUF54_01220 [Polyangiaceae bacterium]|jgi:hypothetical protein|nr:hypothetical protein [Polyangiaceae bacterium]
MNLRDLILDDPTTLADIAAALDALTHEARWSALRELGRSEQRRLYVKAAGAPALAPDHFVPAGVPALKPVRHLGRNTLPLPGSHKFFSKVFCRPEDGTNRAFGFNDAPSRWLIGPGYFVAIPTQGHPRWELRGGVVIDYFQVPDGRVPADWPTVIPNTKRLQRYVYDGTRDYMRGVSRHVSIGAAYKGEDPLDHYFVLCRQDA